MKARIDPKRMARRRIEAGLSQTDLAEKADVSKQLVCTVEGGKANFSPGNLAKIANALDCTIADLLLDDDELSNSPGSAA
ncbi:helix-turn-helix domain-containing protein [Streptomyces sp. NBC_01216]|uniref:helix-turn-helix transcriptional regulator n=1 Tax=Streptomyces sp. NBC_01216 TaxID=2903778 RepID=UPI002E132DBB|nr:helix-turn-helix domain-containing protein [Streptomyces sp. NBC_01216]